MKNLRKEKKISQYRLAQLTGISRDRITKAECGYVDLSTEEASKIKNAISKYKGASHGTRNSRSKSK